MPLQPSNLPANEHSALYEDIQEAVKKARQLAVGRGVDTILRVVTPMRAWAGPAAAIADPWSLVRSPWMAWRDGQSGLTFATSQPLEQYTATGRGRLVRSREWVRVLAARTLTLTAGVETAAAGLPLVVGGFRFQCRDAAPKNVGGPWVGWPDAALALPKRLVVRMHGCTETLLVSAHRVTAETRGLEILDELGRARWHVSAPPESQPDAPSILSRPVERFGRWSERIWEAVRGPVNKVVLALAARSSAPSGWRFDPMSTAWALRDANPGACAFMIQGPDGRAFVGATPEVLFRMSGGAIATHAVAGTVARGIDPAGDEALGQWLLSSPKNREEQAIVARHIAAELERVTTSVRVAEPELLRLPRVQHLVTQIQAEANDEVDPIALIDRLHPTPAVGGFPREEAARWLQQRESMDRGWYAAPVGWCGDTLRDGTFCVGIRSALISKRAAWSYAGAGIVEGSRPEAEWQETQLKLQTASRALRLVRTGPSPDGPGATQPTRSAGDARDAEPSWPQLADSRGGGDDAR